MKLEIQIFHSGGWHDAVTLDIPNPAQGRGGSVRLDYEQDYALQWQDADRVGISRRTLSDIERDAGNRTLPVMNRAFRPFGLRLGLIPRNPHLMKELFAQTASDKNVS